MDDPAAYRCVLTTMGKAYGRKRYELANSIRKFGNLGVPRNFNDARKHAPKNIRQNDWNFLVKLFASKEFRVSFSAERTMF